ncbi:Hsp70 family protein [Dactylosporangium sp. CA-139066]|uniref:Hsp70 family protein n=1 Tax=Dactylosporangium sp. CA-139066 TaxID=3239930 RepID=UPI003D8EDD5D
MSPAPAGYVVGIDLGTSNTVAVIRSPDGRRRPVLFDGAPLMPSAVFLQDNGQLAVGRDAIRLAQLDPARYEPNPKRRIDEPAVLLGSAEIPTVNMLAAILRTVAIGVAEITRFAPPVVLTYPASWGQTRRRTLHDAAIAAGWPQVEMIPEPVAAARYFISALNHPLPRGESMVVYDFGGGTIDIAVVRNEPQGFVVIGSGGLEDVGGLDLDAALVELLGGVLQRTEPDVWRRLQDPRTAQDRRDRRLFWEDVRGAKEMLSRTTVAPVSIPGVEAAMHLTREELEGRIGPMIARTVTETARVVRESGLQASTLAGVMLVGGSSRVPLVARMLHRELDVAPTVLEQPELPVAEGAVVHPAELTTDGRIGTATGTASVGVPTPRPPTFTGPPSGTVYGGGGGTEAMPVPVSGMPVSSVPVSGPGGSVYPVSAVPGSGGAGVSPVSAIPTGFESPATPVSPAVDVPVRPGVKPEEEPATGGRRRLALIAGFAVVLLLLIGGAFALKAYNGKDDNQAGGSGPSSAPPASAFGKWEKLPDVPSDDGFEGAGAAVVNGKLYVIGGFTANTPRTQVANVYVYDIKDRTWSNGPPLPAATSHMSVVVDGNDDIWVMGGWVKSGATDSVWKLSAGKTQWEEGPKLPEGRIGGAAVADSDGILFGGGTAPNKRATDTVWLLGPAGWKALSQPLSDRREKLTAASDGAGTVYFIGGVQQSDGNKTKDTIDIYVQQLKSPNNDVKLDHPREGASAVYLNRIGLCVFGGNEGGTVYDWWCKDASMTPLMPKQEVPRSGMAVAVSGGVLYAVGGYNGSKQLNGTKTLEAFKYTSN